MRGLDWWWDSESYVGRYSLCALFIHSIFDLLKKLDEIQISRLESCIENELNRFMAFREIICPEFSWKIHNPKTCNGSDNIEKVKIPANTRPPYKNSRLIYFQCIRWTIENWSMLGPDRVTSGRSVEWNIQTGLNVVDFIFDVGEIYAVGSIEAQKYLLQIS